MDDYVDSNSDSKYYNSSTIDFLEEHHYRFPQSFTFKRYPRFSRRFPKPTLEPGQKVPYIPPPELAPRPRETAKSSTSTSTLSTSTISGSSATPTALIERGRAAMSNERPSFSDAADKRDLQKREEALANVDAHHVVTSADIQHSAHLACNFPGYLGPDMISLHEQMFCDSQTKTLWRVCQDGEECNNDEDDEGCFHIGERSLVKRGKLHKRSYQKHEIWELNGDITVDVS